eukprot:PhF_6_TR18902/c0_g1_i7/m.27578
MGCAASTALQRLSSTTTSSISPALPLTCIHNNNDNDQLTPDECLTSRESIIIHIEHQPTPTRQGKQQYDESVNASLEDDDEEPSEEYYHLGNRISQHSFSATRSTSSHIDLKNKQRHVMIKTILPPLTSRGRQSEIQSLKSCRGHPCLVQYIDSFSHPNIGTPGDVVTRINMGMRDVSPLQNNNSYLWIITEHIDGIPWGISKASQRPSGPWCGTHKSQDYVVNRTRGILRDLLMGLQFLHDVVGVAHMDIKAENIIVVTELNVEAKNSYKRD